MGIVDWGYVLIGPGRPERTSQRKVMTYSGVDMGEVGTCWEDTLPPRATRPQAALVERNLMLSSVGDGDRVHFASLLCMGASGDDVRWLLGRLGSAGATAVVHDPMSDIAPGGDAAELIAGFERARNALHVRRSRAKKRKSR